MMEWLARASHPSVLRSNHWHFIHTAKLGAPCRNRTCEPLACEASALTAELKALKLLERAMGIEPTSVAWEATILPLYDARSNIRRFPLRQVIPLVVHHVACRQRVPGALDQPTILAAELQVFPHDREPRGNPSNGVNVAPPHPALSMRLHHCLKLGGPKGARTPDLIHAMDALSQLSYRPKTW